MASFITDIQNNHMGLTPDRVNESNYLGQTATHAVHLYDADFVPAPTVGWVLTATDLVGHMAWANPAASALQVYGQQYNSTQVAAAGPTALIAYTTAASISVTAPNVGATYEITYGMDLASAASVTQVIFGAQVVDTTAAITYDSLGAAGQPVGSTGAQIQNLAYGGVFQYVAVNLLAHTFTMSFAQASGASSNINAARIRMSVVRVA